jgi:hypothetical protein
MTLGQRLRELRPALLMLLFYRAENQEGKKGNTKSRISLPLMYAHFFEFPAISMLVFTKIFCLNSFIPREQENPRALDVCWMKASGSDAYIQQISLSINVRARRRRS